MNAPIPNDGPAGSGTKTALILTGGGIPAALFEIGALVALEEMLGRVRAFTGFDFYVGTSAGSFVASLLALGLPAEELRRAVLGTSRMLPPLGPRSIYHRIYHPGSFRPLLRMALRQSLGALRHLRRNGIPLGLATFTVAFHRNLPPGLLSLEPLRSTLADIIRQLGREDRFPDLPRRLYVPAFQLNTGTRVVFGSHGRELTPVSMAVAASCAIPGLFAPVMIDGEPYIDGAVGPVTHLDVALEAGARTLLVVNPMVPIDNDRKEVRLPALDGSYARLDDMGMLYVMGQASKISRAAKLHQEVRDALGSLAPVRLFVVQPDPSEAALFFRSPVSDRHKREDLDFGYCTARRFFESRQEELVRSLAPPPEPVTSGRPAAALAPLPGPAAG